MTNQSEKRWLPVHGQRWLWAVPVIALAGWAAWDRLRPAPVSAPPTAVVEVAVIEQLVQAAGLVQPRVKVDVGAQVTGQVQSVHVQLGQQVRKGDLLVNLDPQLARNEVQQAEASLAQQEAALEGKRIDLTQARRELERQRRLLAGEATSKGEFDKAESDAAKLEVDVRAQSAQRGKLVADLASARLRLGYTQIAAPTDGDVVSIAVQEGQTVNAQQQTPTLLTLAKLDTVTVKAQVAEADVRHIRVGQEASFVTLGDSEQRHRGQVRLIQPLPEKINNAMFYSVLLDVPNPKRALMIDMSVLVSLRVAQVGKALAIPMAALGDKGADGRYGVRVLGADGREASRQVRVGISDAAKVQVLEGLKAGERVVIAPGAAASAPPPT